MTTNNGAFMKLFTRSMVLPAAVAGFILLTTASCSTDCLREKSCDDNRRMQCERHTLGESNPECMAFDAPCYGYHPTCWRPWPECCMPCPPPPQALIPSSEQPTPAPMGLPEMPPVNAAPPAVPLPSPVSPSPSDVEPNSEKIPAPPKPDGSQSAPAKKPPQKSAASDTQQNFAAAAPKFAASATTNPSAMPVDSQAASARRATPAPTLRVAAVPETATPIIAAPITAAAITAAPVIPSQAESIVPAESTVVAQPRAGTQMFVGTLRLDSKPVTCDSPDLAIPPMPPQLPYLSQSQLRIESAAAEPQP